MEHGDLRKLLNIFRQLDTDDTDHEMNGTIGRKMAALLKETKTKTSDIAMTLGERTEAGKFRTPENVETDAEFRAHLVTLQEEHNKRMAREHSRVFGDAEAYRNNIIKDAKAWAFSHRQKALEAVKAEVQAIREGIHKSAPQPTPPPKHDPYGRRPKPPPKPNRWERMG